MKTTCNSKERQSVLWYVDRFDEEDYFRTEKGYSKFNLHDDVTGSKDWLLSDYEWMLDEEVLYV